MIILCNAKKQNVNHRMDAARIDTCAMIIRLHIRLLSIQPAVLHTAYCTYQRCKLHAYSGVLGELRRCSCPALNRLAMGVCPSRAPRDAEPEVVPGKPHGVA